MARNDEPLDATIHIATPENIAFDYRVAGPFRRLPALVIDYVLRIALFVLLWTLLAMFAMLLGFLSAYISGLRQLLATLASAGVAFLLVLWFLVEWFYGGFFESYWNGQTPGKRMMGIRVVTTSGQPINGLQAVLRNILRYVDLFPFLSLEMFSPLFNSETGLPPMYMIPTLLMGLTAMTLTRRYQRVGDIVCGTMVIIEERPWLTGVAALDDARVPHLAALLPADFVASRSLAKALALYADRRRFFPPARRKEVARSVAEPLIRRFGLPPDTSYDLLLCALYYRAFIADRGREMNPLNLPVSPGPAVSAPIAKFIPGAAGSGVMFVTPGGPPQQPLPQQPPPGTIVSL